MHAHSTSAIAHSYSRDVQRVSHNLIPLVSDYRSEFKDINIAYSTIWSISSLQQITRNTEDLPT